MDSRGLLLYTDKALFDRHHTLLERFMRGDHCDLDLKQFRDYRLYTIRVNDADRLLFTTLEKNGVTHFVLLEEILNHDYQKSRFLKSNVLRNFLHKNIEKFDAAIDEADFVKIPALPVELEPCREAKLVRIYDNKFVVFNDAQNQALKTSFPMLISGPAGSGKSCVAMQVLVQCTQRYLEPDKKILFVTQSARLKSNMEKIWNAAPDKIDDSVVFKTYDDLLIEHTNAVTFVGKENFDLWFESYVDNENQVAKAASRKPEITADKTEEVYQELRTISACKKIGEYLALGKRQSSFTDEIERAVIWKIYERYRAYLKANHFAHPSFFEYDLRNQYSCVIVDESQDFSVLQLKLLALLATNNRVCFCMDGHQSLHDNKSKRPYLLDTLPTLINQAVAHVMLPYSHRCPEKITQAADKIIQLKHRLTGGKADKLESTEIKSSPQLEQKGNVHWLEPAKLTDKERKRFAELKNSPDFAIVTNREYVQEARESFDTPLVFTPDEIKGLEYKIILAYRLFDTPIFKAANKNLETTTTKEVVNRAADTVGDEQFGPPFNKIFTAFTRAMATLIIYQAKRHEHRHLTEVLDDKAFLSTWNTVSQTVTTNEVDWEKEKQRQLEMNNTQQAALIQAKIDALVTPLRPPQDAFLDDLLKQNAKRFKKSLFQLFKNPSLLVDKKTADNKKIFEAMDEKKWLMLCEQLPIYFDENAKRLIPLDTVPDAFFNALGNSANAREFGYRVKARIFFQAIANNDLKKIRACLHQGYPINLVDNNGLTAIHHAATKDNLSLMELLWEFGDDLNSRTLSGETPLHLAASEGAIKVGSFLLENGANKDAFTTIQMTPLNRAVQKQQKAFVALLLKHNAATNFSSQGISPLFYAAASNLLDISKLLVTAKDIHLEKQMLHGDHEGETALHAAATQGHVEMIHLLVTAGIDLHIEDATGVPAFFIAVIRDNFDALRALIDLGSDVNYTNVDGDTALGYAIQYSRWEIAKYLVRKGFNIHENVEALFNTILNGDVKGTQFFLSYNVDITREYNVPVGALRRYSKKYERLSQVDTWLKSKNNPSTVKVTLLEVAKLLGHSEVCRQIAAKQVAAARGVVTQPPKVDPTYLDNLLAQDLINFEKIMTALVRSPNIMRVLCHHRTSNGKNFFSAISKDKLAVFINIIFKTQDAETLKLCLQHGLDPNIQVDGTPLIHKAVDQNKIEVIQVLLDHGAEIDIYDIHGQTPLLYAMSKNNLPMVEFLLSKQCNVHKPYANRNLTPIELAISFASIPLTTCLLARGADLKTALKACVLKGRVTLLKTVIEANRLSAAKQDNLDAALSIAYDNHRTATIAILLKAGADCALDKENSALAANSLFAIEQSPRKQADILTPLNNLRS